MKDYLLAISVLGFNHVHNELHYMLSEIIPFW